MHYYSHNIGDYRRDTSHLSLLEHGIYRQMMDTYYLTEKPLPLDHATLMRTHCARTADEVRAVEHVLSDFFVHTEDGYIHKRCDIEIEAFHSKSVSARESAKARWDRVRAEKEAEAMRSHSEGNANHKPLTINQELKDQKPFVADPSDSDDKQTKSKITYTYVMNTYNAICKPTLPGCLVMNDSRKKKVKSMCAIEVNGMKPFQDPEFWPAYFEECLTNQHWIGNNNSDWKADFDFLTNPKNAIKALEKSDV